MTTKPRRKNQCISLAREAGDAAKRAAPEGYEFIVIALDTVGHTACVSSTHGDTSELATQSELERAYRHFVIGEHVIGGVLGGLESRLPEEVILRHTPESPTPSVPPAKGFKN